jgi:hypothetical protein
MGLISITRNELSVGVPMPWIVYDQDGNSLMEQGAVLNTEEQLHALLAQRPLRELSWNAVSSGAQFGENEVEVSSKEIDDALDNASDGVTFKDMRLRVGDRIQLQPPPRLGQDRYMVKLIGYIDNVDLFVSAPMNNGLRLPLQVGDDVVARIFSSQKAFGFSSTIKQVCKIPFNYLHISFPVQIQGSVIRKSPRVRTNIIVSATKADSGGVTERKSGVIIDLSGDGASLKSRQTLGDKGETIRLSFRVNLHKIDTQLAVNAVVRSTFSDEVKNDRGEAMFSHGIQFQNLPPNDSVILQSFIYQQMIEKPHSLT